MDPLQILGVVVSVVGVIAGGFWGLMKLAVGQFNRGLDQRFSAQNEARLEARRAADERLQRIEDNAQRLERELLELRADLPTQYVRREDDIRRETTVNAKLDALYTKLELIAERQTVRG